MLCAAVDCDDGNECTDDACEPMDGLCDYVDVANGTACDFEGLPGLCRDGRCEDAALCARVYCNDDDECTVDRCDPANGTCSNSSQDAEGAPCSAGAGVCASGSCTIVAQTKRYTTRCVDVLFDIGADVPVDLTVSPSSSYANGASSTGFSASFALDQGLGGLLLGLGIEATEITALQVNVKASGATPATLDLPSAETLPFIVDFGSTDAVDTSTVVQAVSPDGVASSVDFTIADWSLGIRIDNMGVPIYSSIAPGTSGPIFSCGPLVPEDGSIRYPQ